MSKSFYKLCKTATTTHTHQLWIRYVVFAYHKCLQTTMKMFTPADLHPSVNSDVPLHLGTPA